nr:MAG TPA: Nuclease [Caudoviricetes sp.]
MSEADEQRTVVEWCALKRIPVYHIPNGGSRNKAEAARLKAQGVKAGVPDLCIPVSRGGYHSLYIEMKYGKNKPTEKQLEWIALLRREGMAAYVCYGADNAIACIERYLAM